MKQVPRKTTRVATKVKDPKTFEQKFKSVRRPGPCFPFLGLEQAISPQHPMFKVEPKTRRLHRKQFRKEKQEQAQECAKKKDRTSRKKDRGKANTKNPSRGMQFKPECQRKNSSTLEESER